MSRFEAFLSRGASRYAGQFDTSELEPSFVPFYESGQRIKVHLAILDREMTGIVGMSTGWKPCFLLMRSTRSQSSPSTLGPNDHIVAVHRDGKTYTPVTT